MSEISDPLVLDVNVQPYAPVLSIESDSTNDLCNAQIEWTLRDDDNRPIPVSTIVYMRFSPNGSTSSQIVEDLSEFCTPGEVASQLYCSVDLKDLNSDLLTDGYNPTTGAWMEVLISHENIYATSQYSTYSDKIYFE